METPASASSETFVFVVRDMVPVGSFNITQQSFQAEVFWALWAFWREEGSSLVEAGGTVFDAPISTETEVSVTPS